MRQHSTSNPKGPDRQLAVASKIKNNSWSFQSQSNANDLEKESDVSPASQSVDHQEPNPVRFESKNQWVIVGQQEKSKDFSAKNSLYKAAENRTEKTSFAPSTQTAEQEASSSFNPNELNLGSNQESAPESTQGPPPGFPQDQTPPQKDLNSLFQVLVKLNYDQASSIDRSDGLEQVLGRIADYFGADFGALVGVDTENRVIQGGKRKPKLLATSNAGKIDQSSQLAVQLEAATNQFLGDFQTLQANQNPEESEVPKVFHCKDQPTLKRVASLLGAETVVAVMVSQDPTAPQMLYLAGIENAELDQAAALHLELLPVLLPPVFLNLHRIHQTGLTRLIRWPLAAIKNNWKWTVASAVMLMVLAVFPFPYTLNCDCSLGTDQKRFVVAPFQGKLSEVLVKPGAMVRAGDLLATMDDQELRLKLAGLQSELAKEKQTALAEKAAGELGKAKIAELKFQQALNEIQMCNHRLKNLELRSAIDGTVIQGQIEHLTGTPVEVGQNLMEVAPLDSLVVQIEIPEYQIRYVKVGQPVRLTVEAYPYQTWKAKVQRIYPQASVKNHDNVFLAEVKLENPDNRLQPGMKGKAKITSDYYPLAWNWFHYPYERLRFSTGWF